MTTHAQLPLLAAVGAALLSGLVKVVKGEPLAALASPAHRGAPEAVAMRAFAYGAITPAVQARARGRRRRRLPASPPLRLPR